jgi:DNA-binding NarL/FixJ family response regulator
MTESNEEIRLLIVDDMPQVRYGLAIGLGLASKAANTRINIIGEAQNGMDAVKQAQALEPDVVLMDLEMPVLDGYAATQCIKANLPSTYVVALTIHGDNASRQKAAQSGVDAFVEKGIQLDELVQIIGHSRRIS